MKSTRTLFEELLNKPAPSQTQENHQPNFPLPSRPEGPYDDAEATPPDDAVSLGALILDVPEDHSIAVKVAGGAVRDAVIVSPDGTETTLTVFAAPRTDGTWPAVAAAAQAAMAAGGYQVTETATPFGPMLTFSVDEGETVSDMRVIGVNGPGWLLRAATQHRRPQDEPARYTDLRHGELPEDLRALLSWVTVRRGTEPMPPGVPLLLTTPVPLGEPPQTAEKYTSWAV